MPRYVPGHVHWRDLKREEGEFDLLPNFRLPTLVHTRSAVKWLYEISHSNPLWISTTDARQYGLKTGDLVKLRTRIGYFVTRAWVTEGIRPGVLGMSHHLGRWRLKEDTGGVAQRRPRWSRSPGKGMASTACASSTARARLSATIPTASGSGGTRSACIRT